MFKDKILLITGGTGSFWKRSDETFFRFRYQRNTYLFS